MQLLVRRCSRSKGLEVDVLYILIPLSLLLVALAVAVFLVMSEHDQFEDLNRPAHDILMDDDRPPHLPESSTKTI
jgi:cbb3-type cytochrome oxidase maturation protein